MVTVLVTFPDFRIGTSANLKPNLLLSSSLNTSWQARSSLTVNVTVTA
jgi:hypothetical protein